MKICFLCADPGIPVFGRKGCSTHVRETCLTLMDRGHDVRLVCSNSEGDDSERHRLDVINVEPFRSRKLGFDLRLFLLDRRIRRAMEREIRPWNPDAIYERYSLYSRTGTLLAHRWGLPHLLEINAVMTREQSNRIRFIPWARRRERQIFRDARHIVVVSEPLRKEVGIFRGGEEDISRMPMAVNTRHFNPSVDGSVIRKALGLEGRFVIGYVGTLTGWHGIALLFDLADRLREEGLKDFTILVVGGDDRRLDLNRTKVRDRSLGDFMNFIGPVAYKEVPRYLRAMDVAIVPDTTYWSSPAKLFEYQGCGLPTLAPRYAAIENAMDDGVEGFIFEPKNINQMAKGIQRLEADLPLRRKMGARARERAVNHHSWDRHAKRVIQIFEDQKRIDLGGNGSSESTA